LGCRPLLCRRIITTNSADNCRRRKMFKVALLVAAALRCAGAADIAFDVQLGDDAVVRFQLGDGQDLAETVRCQARRPRGTPDGPYMGRLRTLYGP
jgi:hypothetical protein